MERTITHLVPRLDTERGVVIGWQGRVTLRMSGIEAMDIIEMALPGDLQRPLDGWRLSEAIDVFARALDTEAGELLTDAQRQVVARYRSLVSLLRSRARFPLLEKFTFPEG